MPQVTTCAACAHRLSVGPAMERGVTP
jgi:hypothetical protein